MNIKEAIVGSKLRAEAEAVALELPQELALDLWDGIVADDLNNWSRQEYLEWTYSIEAKYKIPWDRWVPLYKAVSLIVSEFGGMLIED